MGNYIGKSVIALLVAGSIIVYIALTSGLDISGEMLLILSLITFSIACFLYSDNQQFNTFVEIVLLIGFLFALIGCYLLEDLYDSQRAPLLGVALSLIYSTLIWWRTKGTAWICICALALTFYQVHQMLLKLMLSYRLDFPWDNIYFFVLDITLVFCFWRISQQKSKANNHFNIIGWSYILFVTCQILYFIKSAFSIAIAIAPELPLETSLSEFFHVITGRLFTQTNLLMQSVVFIYALILPLTFFSLAKKYKMSKVQTGLVIGLGFIVSLSFITKPMVSLSFSLLLLAYPLKNRTLFGVILFWLIVSLWDFYYSLTVPLMYKAILLGAMGMIFLICYALLREKVAAYETEMEKELIVPILKWKVGTVVLGIGVLLAAFNQKIVTYEEVLTSGKPIILQFAPHDPRSLMQGDYMAMNYQLNNEVQSRLDSSNFEEGKHYALLSSDENSVAHLCRLENTLPTNFEGCDADVYIPVKIRGYWDITLPTHEYFFPEGKGKYFSQAEYAEYRFKNGKALLYRLLDKDLNAL